jgi:pilus retraction protein PilT
MNEPDKNDDDVNGVVIPDGTLANVALDLLSGEERFTDLHIESDQPAMLRRSARQWTPALNAAGDPIVVSHARILEFLDGVFMSEADTSGSSDKWKRELHQKGSLHPAVNLTRATPGGSFVSCRVRCTVQKQLMGEAIGLVMRPLRAIPASAASLGLPVQVSGMLATSARGLIVVTGPTGSGKSTTLAAFINEINESTHANILTIEDPVEFVHDRVKSIINQRELGIDVSSYEAGVRDALRFVPDVIQIGEIRDAETMMAALRAGVSGHLVLTTMHAPTAVDAIRKMIAYLGNSQADTQSLASCLVGVIAQALVPGLDPKGPNHLAFEVLSCRDPVVADVVGGSGGDVSGARMNGLENKVRTGELGGIAQPMMTRLLDLVDKGLVDPRVAATVAVHPDDKKKLLEARRPPGVGSTATEKSKSLAGATGGFFGTRSKAP